MASTLKWPSKLLSVVAIFIRNFIRNGKSRGSEQIDVMGIHQIQPASSDQSKINNSPFDLYYPPLSGSLAIFPDKTNCETMVTAQFVAV